MRILVCGSRHYGNVNRTKPTVAEESAETQKKVEEYKHIHEVLNQLVIEHSSNYNPSDNWLPTDIVIISGAAKGVDSAAADFAVCNYCQLEEYPADWKKHGKAAGAIRNRQMLREGKPDLVVAFLAPSSRGTRDMVNAATEAGVPVKVINVQ